MKLVIMKAYYDYNNFTDEDQEYINQCREIEKYFEAHGTQLLRLVEIPSDSNSLEIEVVELN